MGALLSPHGVPEFHPPAWEGTPPADPMISLEPYAAPKPGASEASVAAGSKSPTSTRAGINILTGKRATIAGATAFGIGAAGLGLGVGLEEGIARALGGQGIGGAAINPDPKPKPKDPTNPFELFSNPLVMIAVAGLIALVVLKK